MMNLGIHNLYEIVDIPTLPIFLQCGKPTKNFKNYEDWIGKKLDLSQKSCIIGYPLMYLSSRGEAYEKKISYTIEVLKNELLELGKIGYREGKLEVTDSKT